MNVVLKVHNSKYSARIFNVPCSDRGPETSCLALVPLSFSRSGAVVPYLVTTAYLPPLQFIINQSRHYSMLYYVSNWKPLQI
jgi:hypothetical protein